MPNVCKSSDIAPGHLVTVDLYGTAVAIANVGSEFYAIGDACPHASCSLSQGLLEGKILTCQTDGSQFDLTSGNVLSGPATERVRTYRVQVRGDDLSI